jgi:hypothetical protein
MLPISPDADAGTKLLSMQVRVWFLHVLCSAILATCTPALLLLLLSLTRLLSMQ